MTTDIFRLSHSQCDHFLHLWLNIGFVTRVTQRVPLVDQDRNSYPRSPPVFSGVSVCSFFRFLCSVLCIIAGHFVLLFFLTLHCTSLHVIRWHLQHTMLVSWNCDQHWKYIWRVLTCVTEIVHSICWFLKYGNWIDWNRCFLSLKY